MICTSTVRPTTDVHRTSYLRRPWDIPSRTSKGHPISDVHGTSQVRTSMGHPISDVRRTTSYRLPWDIPSPMSGGRPSTDVHGTSHLRRPLDVSIRTSVGGRVRSIGRRAHIRRPPDVRWTSGVCWERLIMDEEWLVGNPRNNLDLLVIDEWTVGRIQDGFFPVHLQN